MYRYLLFAYRSYEERGGIADLVLTFNTVEELQEAIYENDEHGIGLGFNNIFDIYDIKKNEVYCYETDNYSKDVLDDFIEKLLEEKDWFKIKIIGGIMMSEKIKDVNNLEVGDFVSVFIRGDEISGDMPFLIIEKEKDKALGLNHTGRTREITQEDEVILDIPAHYVEDVYFNRLSQYLDTLKELREDLNKIL